jgi:hypothetical protein
MIRSTIAVFLIACVPQASDARATAYEAELVACNRTANSLQESIDCENSVRARYGRPFRASPRSIDGGAR